MGVRKVALVGVAVLLAGVALAVPTSASAALPPFTCGTQHGGSQQNGNPAPITAVRLGTHAEGQPAYDRFVLEFNSSSTVPAWTAIPKSSANFTRLPSGLPITLKGSAGIRLDFFAGTVPAWSGQTDFVTGFPQLAEAYKLEDFEGSVKWGLGLNHQSCKRIFELTAPTRLVIDVPQ